MSKRSRLFIILAVLVLCFVFLWPSISWYGLTPKEDQAMALSSLEKIRDYAMFMADEDVNSLLDAAKADPTADVDSQYKYLVKQAKKNYKAYGKKAPKDFNLGALVNGFTSKGAFDESEDSLNRTKTAMKTIVEDHYREKILSAKDKYKNSVKLGLDLSGGMSIIIRADLDAAVAAEGEALPSEYVDEYKKQEMEHLIDNLRSRIDRFGLSEPIIRQQGEDRVYIELPGAADANRINSIIMGKGILNFREVYEDETAAFNQYYLANPSKTFTASGELLDLSLIPEDAEVLGLYKKDEYGLDERLSYVVVKKEYLLDGNNLKSSRVGRDNITGEPELDLELDSEGAEIFAEYTAAHVGEAVAIVSDNKIKSYGTIQSSIPNGQVAVTNMSYEEAQNLEKVLKTATFNIPLTVESQQVIGASMGEKAIHEGLFAVIFGLLAVMIFMLIWYKGAGINAIVSQILNLYMMFSILSAFNLTITLPSIAGMILTIGMAVDANVIIFERIKDELKLGKGRAAAISAGFGHAFWAIMDSNITTFIAALFLSQFGSGAIQGFAVSLSIGVVSSVFTALVVSRLMFDFSTDVLKKQKVSISWRIK